jgi:hypothetical protein
MLMVGSLVMMVVWSWMMLPLESLMMSRVLVVRVKHCAISSDLIHSVASPVIIAQTVLEGPWPTPRLLRWVGQL